MSGGTCSVVPTTSQRTTLPPDSWMESWWPVRRRALSASASRICAAGALGEALIERVTTARGDAVEVCPTRRADFGSDFMGGSLRDFWRNGKWLGGGSLQFRPNDSDAGQFCGG